LTARRPYTDVRPPSLIDVLLIALADATKTNILMFIHLSLVCLFVQLTLQATSSICMGANIGHHAARNFKEDWLSKPTHLTALRPVRALRTFSATGQGPGPRAG
jgi:hypothetical protein